MSDSNQSAVETSDGLYYIRMGSDDGSISRYDLYRVPKSSGVYRPTYKDANPMKVTVSNKTLKAAKLRKKTLKVSAVKVKKARGKVTYKRVSIKCSKKLKKAAKKKIKVQQQDRKDNS